MKLIQQRAHRSIGQGWSMCDSDETKGLCSLLLDTPQSTTIVAIPTDLSSSTPRDDKPGSYLLAASMTRGPLVAYKNSFLAVPVPDVSLDRL